MSIDGYRGDPTLNDHKRQGSKLEAPFTTIKKRHPIIESTWHFDRLPECVWVAELLHFLPLDVALDLLTDIHKLSKSSTNHPSFSSLACWWASDKAAAQKIVGSLEDAQLNDLVFGLAHFASLYPDYPVCTYLDFSKVKIQDHSIEQFKKRLIELLDRSSFRSSKLFGIMVHAELLSGKLKLSRDINLPDLNLLFQEPEDSTEYNHAIGFARSNQLGQFAFLDRYNLPQTSKYFWNRGLEIEKRTLARFEDIFKDEN